MTRWKLTIEYDGRPFAGWQIQKDDVSVQQVLEEAIAKFSNEKINTIVAGRTDAGVHAYGQVVHFDLEKEAKPFVVQDAINAHLRPHPVSILKAEIVDEHFNARLSAKKRHYLYRIINRKADLALDFGRAWRVAHKLNIEAMQTAANYLIGKHDFSSFRVSQCQAKSPVKTLDQLDITRNGDEVLIHTSARSFLHHQVRNIVGTLAEIGRNKRKADDMKTILEAKSRAAAGQMAPADGLYFLKVDY